MKPALAVTSVPGWAAEPSRPRADLTGRYWTIVVIGDGAEPVVDEWVAQIGGSRTDPDVRIHRVDDNAARKCVDDELAQAVVGWRLMIAGPADACLRLRAHAMSLGVADDELTVASTDTATRDVMCAHCGTVTSATVGLEEVAVCAGCERNLFVYYHVSRRLGAHLGFMVDAERVS